MSDTGTYLGHRPKGSARTTAIYTDDIDDPSYLAEEAAVVEAFQQLLREEVAMLTGTIAMGSKAA